MILATSDPLCIVRDPTSLAPVWSELARHRAYPTVFLTPEWHAVVRAHDRRQHTTLSVLDDRGVAALACDANGVIGFAGGELTDVQDIVAAPSEAAAVAETVGRWVAAQPAPRARFEYVPEESPTPNALGEGLRSGGFDVRVERLVPAPRLRLPATFDTYVKSLGKKERHELRRKIRRLENGRRVEFRIASDRERGAVLDRFVALHRRSRGEKAEFMTPSNERFFRDIADALGARGWLRLGALAVDGEDVAVLFALAYEGGLSLYNASYEPSLSALSVGIVSQAYAIRAAIDEGLSTYDFLRGDEPYKYDLGGQETWLVRIEAARS